MTGGTLLRQLINLLRDILFVVIYSKNLPQNQKQSAVKRLLGYACLSATLLMYSAESGGAFSFAIVRTCFRILCYYAFLHLVKQISWKEAAYYAVYINTICIIAHNLFLTPLTRPVLLGTIHYTNYDIFNWLISWGIVNGVVFLCYAIAYRLTPLNRIRMVHSIRICALTALSAGSIYMNNTLRSITDQGSQQVFELSAYAIILQIALFCCVIFMEQLQYKTEDAFEAKIETFSTKTMLENIKQQNQNNDRIRHMRHDLRNHMLTIRCLVEQEQKNKCLEYIDHLTETYTTSKVMTQTGNMVLDSILSVKLNMAVERDILVSMTADFSCVSFLNDVDVCIIFANLLDNAIEACELVERTEERYIDIRSAIKGEKCIYTIQNSFNGRCVCEKGEFKTAKQDEMYHGIGIKSVRNAVKRYQGVLHFEQNKEERFFKTILIFQTHVQTQPSVQK